MRQGPQGSSGGEGSLQIYQDHLLRNLVLLGMGCWVFLLHQGHFENKKKKRSILGTNQAIPAVRNAFWELHNFKNIL